MTTHYTAAASVPYPDDDSPCDVATQIEDVAMAVDSIMVPRYPSTAARDAAIPVPVEGQFCYVSQAGIRQLQGYNGSSWLTIFPASRVATKTVDTTSSEVNYHNDPHLFLALEANSYYTFQLMIGIAATNDNGDAKVAMGLPTGATMEWGAIYPSNCGGNAVTERLMGGPADTSTGDFAFNVTGTRMTLFWHGGIHTASTSGLANFGWRVNNVGTGCSLTVYAGSYFRLDKVVQW